MTCLFLQMYFWPAIQFPCIEHVKTRVEMYKIALELQKSHLSGGGDRHKNLDDWFSKPLIVSSEHHKTDRLFYSLLHFLQVSESESYLVMSNSLRPHGLYSHGLLQSRILEWVAFPFSRGSSQPRDRTQVSCMADRFFTSWATREAQEYWSG